MKAHLIAITALALFAAPVSAAQMPAAHADASHVSSAVALKLAMQTVYGAAKMALEANKHLGELKDEVTSPGGTTIAGLYAMEQKGFHGTVMDAVVSATRRSQELGKG